VRWRLLLLLLLLLLLQVLDVLCGASEYDELPVRHNEDVLNTQLAQQVGVTWLGLGWGAPSHAGIGVCAVTLHPRRCLLCFSRHGDTIIRRLGFVVLH
jgi:hypothetical protein